MAFLHQSYCGNLVLLFLEVSKHTDSQMECRTKRKWWIDLSCISIWPHSSKFLSPDSSCPYCYQNDRCPSWHLLRRLHQNKKSRSIWFCCPLMLSSRNSLRKEGLIIQKTQIPSALTGDANAITMRGKSAVLGAMLIFTLCNLATCIKCFAQCL